MAGSAKRWTRGSKPWARRRRIESMETMPSRPRPEDPGSRRRTVLGVVAGLLAGAAALGVGQLIAGLTGANGSPVVAVGQLQIDHTPEWLKNFAIKEFGSHDKLALVIGIVCVLAIFAGVIGVLAVRRFGYGLAGLGAFTVIRVFAGAAPPGARGARPRAPPARAGAGGLPPAGRGGPL